MKTLRVLIWGLTLALAVPTFARGHRSTVYRPHVTRPHKPRMGRRTVRYME